MSQCTRLKQLRRDDAAGRDVSEQSTNQRQRLARVGMLPPDNQDQGKAHQQEEQAREPVLQADRLVVGREQVSAQQSMVILSKRSMSRKQRIIAPRWSTSQKELQWVTVS
jgi:hypothetical protein